MNFLAKTAPHTDNYTVRVYVTYSLTTYTPLHSQPTTCDILTPVHTHVFFKTTEYVFLTINPTF
jgi:hypothetical protein